LPTLRSRGDPMARRRDVSTRLTRRNFLALAAAGTAAGTHPLAFPAVVRAQEPIRIGQLVPFTGFLGAIGEYGKQGATLAVEELNEKGGVLGRKIELITEDEANPGVAVQKARKLIEKDRVVAIEGLVSSASCLAVGDEVQGAKILMINAGANSDVIRSNRGHPNFLEQYAEAGMTLEVAGGVIDSADAWPVGESLRGHFPIIWWHELATPASHAWAARYVKRWGRPPDNQAYGDYVAVHAIAQAV